MDKQTIILSGELQKNYAHTCIDSVPEGHCMILQEVSRTIEQNAYQWPYLEGFSKQKEWPVNGKSVFMSKDEWKDVLTSAFEKEVKVRLAAEWDGDGVVMLGKKTSQFGKKKFALWMQWLIAAAVLSDVEPVFKNGSVRRDNGRFVNE